MKKLYELPALPYPYDALDPVISEEQLALHHDFHHQAYVDNANKLLEKLEMAREDGDDENFGALYKELSFNIGGHILHSLYWENLISPVGRPGLEGELKEAIIGEFGSEERFIEEFAKTALKVEGSGWVTLSYCKKTGRPMIDQVEKHNVNVYPAFNILLAVDVWEHAYYLDYQNKRGDYIDRIWDIVNWQVVAERYQKVRDQK